MEKQAILETILSREALAEWMSYYESYYQTALGYVISFSSGFDTVYAVKKVRELGLKADFQTIIVAILKNSLEADNEISLRSILRNEAVRKALDDFLERDNELLNKQVFADTMRESIDSGDFFTPQLVAIMEENYPVKRELWKSELSDEMLGRLKEMFQQDGWELLSSAMLSNEKLNTHSFVIRPPR